MKDTVFIDFTCWFSNIVVKDVSSPHRPLKKNAFLFIKQKWPIRSYKLSLQNLVYFMNIKYVTSLTDK